MAVKPALALAEILFVLSGNNFYEGTISDSTSWRARGHHHNTTVLSGLI
jgi:hypothetical protein